MQILEKYSSSSIEIKLFNQVQTVAYDGVWMHLRFVLVYFSLLQSQYPRIVVEDNTPWPAKGRTDKAAW